MALQNDTRTLDPSLAVELGLVTAVLAGLFLWQRLLGTVTAALGPPASGGAMSGLAFGGLASGVPFLLGLVALVGGYAAARDIDLGLRAPSRSALPILGLAVLAPIALVALTKLVGVATSVAYNSLTKTAVAADPPAGAILLLAGLHLLVSVPALVLVCQVLVQGSFARVTTPVGAIALTTAVTGFVMRSTTGGLTAVPDLGRLVGLAVVTLAVGIALVVRERSEREWVRYLGYLPVTVVVAVIVLDGVARTDSVAAGLFVVTHLAVLGLAAAAYERTESLVAPALTYTSLLLANMAVVVLFEAGMQSW